MKNKHVFLTLLAFTVFLLTACQGSSKSTTDKKDTAKEQSSREEPSLNFDNLEVTRVNGLTDDMSNILTQAELTVIHVWDPSCEPCKDELVTLGDLSVEYLGRGVQMVGIIKGVDDVRNEDALAVIAQTDANYVQLLDSEKLEKQVSGIQKDVPFTILVDRDGKQLGKIYTEAKDKAFWAKEIEKYHKQVCVNDHPAECSTG